MLVLDLSGNLIRSTFIDEDEILDLSVFDEENIYGFSHFGIHKTTNGGNSWIGEDLEALPTVIGFPTVNQGIVVYDKLECAAVPNNFNGIGYHNSTIAYTNNGGENWQESPPITQGKYRYKSGTKRENNVYVFVYEAAPNIHTIYEINIL